MRVDFALVDVFTDRPLAGNPLAVFLDAGAILESTMKAITREFGHAETTFVLPPLDPRATRRLRFFTATGVEVFGAGHNALGAWWALAAMGRLPLSSEVSEFVQEIGDRLLPVEVTAQAGRPARVFMTQSAPEFGPELHDIDRLSAALGLARQDLELEGLIPQAVSTGARHLLVPARSRSALARVQVDPERLVRLASTVGCHGCYLFCLDPEGPGATARARAFNPGIGITEDAATGSAAGPLAAYLVSRGVLADGATAVIEQGVEIGRPSRIEVVVDGELVRVGGKSVLSGEGFLDL